MPDRWPGAALTSADGTQHDDGGHIGNHLEELIGDTDAGHLEPDLQRVAEAEEQAGQQHAAGAPAAEDDGSQSDKAAAGHDAVGVGAGVAGGQVRAAHTGQCAADGAGDVLHADDVDAQRGGSLGMLAYRLVAQARTGAVEKHGREHHQQDP